MRCRNCGSVKFALGHYSDKYCMRCGAVAKEFWNKTDRLAGTL